MQIQILSVNRSLRFYSDEFRFDFRLEFLQSVICLNLKVLPKNGQTRNLDLVEKKLTASRSDAKKHTFVFL